MPHVTLTGLAGAQQSAIASAFSAAGWTVTGTSRTAQGAHRADLETGDGLERAFDGADVVVFTLPQDHTPGRTLRMARAIAKAARGVPRVILNAASRIVRSDVGVFANMRHVQYALCDLPLVTLEPTIYMDNLLAPWSIPGILSGTLAYPASPEAAIAWMSHRTLADCTLAAATADVIGQSIRLGGAEALTGPQIAELLAAHLKRPVSYATIPLPGFAAGLNQAFGAPAGDRIAELYAHLADHPDAMRDGAKGVGALGVTPESFAAFIARQDWSLPG